MRLRGWSRTRAGSWAALALAAALAPELPGCATTSSTQTVTEAAAAAPVASARSGATLVLDRADFRIGTTVQFSRVPSGDELYDLHQVTGIAHVLLTLTTWPSSYAQLEPLRQLPAEADLIVVLRGYPPTREAADAWNLVETRQRLVLVVDGPPASSSVVADLNAMRGLERVIVDTERPSRAGFERLQRPLSFRVVRD